jgi:coenzyme PQQ synthesis protein D (PqqD)
MLTCRKEDLICREVDGSIVGLDLRTSRYFSLNATGTFLWRQLENGAEVDDLVSALAAEHSLDRSAAANDVDVFVTSLREQDLLA